MSIAGIGEAAADAIATHGPYKSITDFCKKAESRAVTGRKLWLDEGKLGGTVRALAEAGAFAEIDEE